MENKIQKWPVHHSRQGVWSTGGIGVHSDDDFYVEVEASDRAEAQEKGQQIYLSGGNSQAVEQSVHIDGAYWLCKDCGQRNDVKNRECEACGKPPRK